ncbi:MAG: virulence factor TspB C-terminal domain-related protein [Psychrobacter alimentarius]
MKKFSHIFLSLVIVFSTTLSAYAASPSGWSIQTNYMQGATAVIEAAKQGFRSSITHLPSATNIGKELLKVGGGLAVAYAMSQLLDAGVDWVMDPANNRVSYVDKKPLPDSYLWIGNNGTVSGATADAACRAFKPVNGYTHHHTEMRGDSSARCFAIHTASGNVVDNFGVDRTVVAGGVDETPKYIPIEAVAAKVIANAAAGHEPSKQLIKTVAVTDFNAGSLDSDLEANAKPSDEPYNPDDTVPTVPFDPSSIIAAIQSLKSTIDNLATDIKQKFQTLAVSLGVIEAKVDNVAAEQQRTMQVINDGMADVVAANQATEARVGDVVAAIEGLEGNMLTGEVINAAVDKVISAGHSDTQSIVAAIEAIEGNTLDGKVINDAVDRVLTNDDANAKATQDVISESADKAIEAGQADATKVADAVDAQTDAITTTDPTTGEKSLSLPSFCSWASPVCSFIDWSKTQWLEFTVTFTALKDWLFEDAPADDKDNTVDTPVLPVTPVQVAINFVGSCPAPLTFEYKIYNQTFKPSVPFTPMCEVAVMINPVIKICASIAAIFIVAGIRQGNS